MTTPLASTCRALIAAVRFLTTLPTPAVAGVDEVEPGRSALCYPVVGALIGLLLLLAAMLPGLQGGAAAAVLLILWVAVTGGLHLDGLGDCADAWLGGLADRDETLRIMKDPHSGSMAVIVLILLLLSKFATLSVLLDAAPAAILWTVPVWGRLSILPLLMTTPYARQQGYGAALRDTLPRRGAILVALATLAALWIVLPLLLWCLMILVSGAAVWLVRTLTLRRLGGFTGDVVGAQVELLEAALLVTLVGFYGSGA